MVNANRAPVVPMLTSSEVAAILNVHINTVRRWSNQGTLKAYQLGPRGDRRFRREDIEEFLAGHSNQNGEPESQEMNGAADEQN
ncbi:helix-turn-helix domain-containing protein [Dehalogenimonas alkenigignens]|uniref:DNA binding domain, excisionase family n=1 Tax=Dehalogenimonas alkenigignens TaxID=1217799 RepID=A0A0W0GHX2_9CHLR|nr:helix-turn-helix domain-containing protein [Dehalogenimonas alkenigignens]KTB48157.1 DNA binding domain, excisionase family [Dehalogenimonas alkenigignens]PVV84396.1 DNA-binding protein [Dehalogenimonas alkenigignens]